MYKIYVSAFGILRRSPTDFGCFPGVGLAGAKVEEAMIGMLQSLASFKWANLPDLICMCPKS